MLRDELVYKIFLQFCCTIILLAGDYLQGRKCEGPQCCKDEVDHARSDGEEDEEFTSYHVRVLFKKVIEEKERERRSKGIHKTRGPDDPDINIEEIFDYLDTNGDGTVNKNNSNKLFLVKYENSKHLRHNVEILKIMCNGV